MTLRSIINRVTAPFRSSANPPARPAVRRPTLGVESLETREVMNYGMGGNLFTAALPFSPQAQAIISHGARSYGYNPAQLVQGYNLSNQSQLGAQLGYGYSPFMAQPRYLQGANNLYSLNRQVNSQLSGWGSYRLPAISYFTPQYANTYTGLSPQTLFGLGGASVGSWNFGLI